MKKFWIESYKSDPIAFACEGLSFLFLVSSSLTLAITANAPNMLLVYPGFFLGSILSLISSYRRKIGWTMMLTIYFIIVNGFGFGRAIGWW